MQNFDLVILLRLGIAIVLTGLLGWERQAMGKAAGLRTHILVGFGATLFVGLGEALVRHFSSYEERLQFDPTRVLEAVVAGVAFLGAGMIFFATRERRVHGLTTAASIWTTAGVGMAVGLGRYILAMGATALLLLVLRGLGALEDRWLSEERQRAGEGDADAGARRRSARGLPPPSG
jgi:putative Mg2+ transporter-C (MgtC) family protein